MRRHKWSELRDEHRAALASDPDGLVSLERERAKAREAASRPSVSLATLRRLRDLTQQDVARRLDMPQSNVSRIENQEDLFLSTLGAYVRALGGELVITAVFPDDQLPIAVGGAQADDSTREPMPA